VDAYFGGLDDDTRPVLIGLGDPFDADSTIWKYNGSQHTNNPQWLDED
jgi:hypothetical protein